MSGYCNNSKTILNFRLISTNKVVRASHPDKMLGTNFVAVIRAKRPDYLFWILKSVTFSMQKKEIKKRAKLI